MAFAGTRTRVSWPLGLGLALTCLVGAGCNKQHSPPRGEPTAARTVSSLSASPVTPPKKPTDPWAQMKEKYDELAQLVQNHQAQPDEALTATRQWLTNNEATLTALCQQQEKLVETAAQTYGSVALAHLNDGTALSTRLDTMISRWPMKQQLAMQPLMLKLVGMCL